MAPERWRQIDRLYHCVLEQEKEQRIPFLKQACEGDEELRRELESLLEQAEKTGSFLEAPALEIAAKSLAQHQARTVPRSGVANTADPMVGRTISHYQILEKLGGGGMGVVYQARDMRLGRSVALKFLPGVGMQGISSMQRQQAVKRFKREARAASALNHPNICVIHDIGEYDGHPFIVMEYINGRTLAALIAEGRLPVSRAIEIACQVGRALQVAHDQGVFHRDISPANIMVTPDGQAKIMDFGLATLAESGDGDGESSGSTPVTLPGRVMGTPSYMSPEQAKGERADQQSDIWALGVVLYEMVSGQRPFRGDNLVAVLRSILDDEPRPLSELRADAPPGLDQVIAKSLAKERSARYPCAQEMVADLQGLRAPSQAAEAREVASRQKKKVGISAAALALLTLATWVGYKVTHKVWRPSQQVQQKTRPEAESLHSIVILPFRNLGQSHNDDYFGVGLADVLSAKLTNARFLEVRSPYGLRNPASLDLRGAGQQLGVDAVLSGSYQIEGGKLSFSYSMLDVRRNVEIAGDSLEDSFAHSIDLEQQLANKIVDTLKVSASRKERVGFTAVSTHQNQAFEAYLRSDYEMELFWKSPSAAQLSRTEQYLKQALDIDPEFTLALVSLARLHWIAVFWDYASDPGILDRAEQEANRAIEIDPSLGDAYAAKALIQYQSGDLGQVRLSLREAFARSPNSALAYYAAGFYYMGRGLPDWSLRAFQRAKELDPELVRREIGMAHRYGADFEGAEQQLREDLRTHPDDVPTEVALAGVLVARNNLQEAEQMTDDLLRRAPDDPLVQYTLALLRVRQGKDSSVDSWLVRYQDTYWSDAGSCVNVAGVLAMAHRPAQALRWIRRAGELGIRNYIFLVGNPFYAHLQQDPAFRSYLESVRRECDAARQSEEQDPTIPAAIRKPDAASASGV